MSYVRPYNEGDVHAHGQVALAAESVAAVPGDAAPGARGVGGGGRGGLGDLKVLPVPDFLGGGRGHTLAAVAQVEAADVRLDLHRGGALPRGGGVGVGVPDATPVGVDPRGIGEVVSVIEHSIGLAAVAGWCVCRRVGVDELSQGFVAATKRILVGHVCVRPAVSRAHSL